MDGKIKRAIITGIGVVSPLGNDVDTFTEGVVSGRSGISKIDEFDTSPFRTPFGGVVRNFDPAYRLSEEEIKLLPDPYLRFALAAARDALQDAGLCWSKDNPPDHKSAIVVGTCNGGLKTAEEQYRIILGLKPGQFHRGMNLLIRYYALGKALSHCLCVCGPVWLPTTACSSSTSALGIALELVTQGFADTVLVGGADALCLATMSGFNSLKATSTERTAPFSMPLGLNLGEGAGFFVVEEKEKAESRGAKALGEILGYAFTSDAYHPTAPDPRGDGAYRTMAAALARSKLDLSELGCISAHGTGTEANDRSESKAIARLIGSNNVPVHSFKSQVGHCLGAAGILEATAALVAMNRNVVPATINFSEPRPGCNLDFVPNTPQEKSYSAFLSCNYAFGGNNAGVVIGKHRAQGPGPVQPDPKARVVFTGSGAVTSLGLGVKALVEGLLQGRRGFKPALQRVKDKTEASLAGLVQEFGPREIDKRLDFRGMNLISQYATAAARLALEDAGIKISPKEGLETGIINGVCVGPDEESQMRTVISSGGAESDINSFSQIVANATAGWVSSTLSLKGYTTTVAQGIDAGLYSILAAYMAVKSRSKARVLAGASDELFSRYIKNYDEIGLLYSGDLETDYKIRLNIADKRVLAEGAAYVVVEEESSARQRGAEVIAELVGFGMTTDTDSFYEPNLCPKSLAYAVGQALESAGWSAGDVGLILWSPQGNRNDLKILEGLRNTLGKKATAPMLTSVFNTGYCESACGTSTLAAALYCFKNRIPLWPQLTGIEDIDNRQLPSEPVPIIAVASSDLGYNLALAIEPKMSDKA